MSTALIRFYNHSHDYVKFEGDRDIIMELREKYTFEAPNFRYDKRYKMGYWDGKISMINMKDNHFLAGLLPTIKVYLEKEGIEYIDDTDLTPLNHFEDEDIINFYKDIKGVFKPHDSQVLAVRKSMNEGRNIVLAPTSNGKSYIIHALNVWHVREGRRVLIVVDRSNLVTQLKRNFEDEYNSLEHYTTATIYDDPKLVNEADVVTSTWQSLKDAPTSWFKKFDVIIGDEVHKFAAKSLMGLMAKCKHIAYRHGLTATLSNDCKTSALTLIGMFGTATQTITLQEQIAQGISARPIVYVIELEYSRELRNSLRNAIKEEINTAASKGKKTTDATPFQVEAKFLEALPQRNQLLINIAKAQKGNTLIAFRNEEQGKILYEMISENFPDIPHHLIYGKVNRTKRDEIIVKMNDYKNSVSAVSFGTFSTGLNIPALNNLIIGSQVKSAITVPQLIGRMIRLVEGKDTTNIIDICDNLKIGNWTNTFARHFNERMKFYLKNNFEIRVKTINIS